MSEESTKGAPAGVPGAGEIVAGKYRVVRVASAGRTTVVLEAQHEELGRPAALAIMRIGVATPEQITRFLEHARAVARIRSDHAARVLDIGEMDDGCPFVAMDQLDGDDLAQCLEARGALDPEEAVDLMLQALEALAAAHSVGVLHRELRPANLLRTAGVLKVLDFRGAHASASVSPYSAPEQVRDPAVLDARSDVWSVGAVLYELLTGVAPFGAGPEESRTAILAASPRELSELGWEVPSGLSAVVMRCLRADPAARYPDADELAVALAPFGSGAQAPCVAQAQAALAKPPRTPRISVSARVEERREEPERMPATTDGGGTGSISAQIVAPVADGPNQTTYNGLGGEAPLTSFPPIAPSIPVATPAVVRGRSARSAWAVTLAVAAVALTGLAGTLSTRALSHRPVAAAAAPATTVAAQPVIVAPPEPSASAAPEPVGSEVPAADDDPGAATPEPGGSAHPRRGWNRRQMLQSRQ